MRERPLLCCGAMNMDELHRVRWRDATTFLGPLLPRGGEVRLGGEGAEVLAWLEAHGTPLGRHPGGSAANTAAALGRLGVPVAFCGRVGDDAAGRFLLSSLGPVDPSMVQVGGCTGRCIILVDEEGERSILKIPGANDAWEPPSSAAPRRGAWWGIHLTSLTGDDGPARQVMLVAAAGNPPLVSLDPGEVYAIRGRAALDPLLSRATHLFLNRRELRLLYGEPPDRVALFAPPRRLVMAKLGADGLLLEGAEGRVRVPAHPVEAVDATGAGDAAAAGLLAAERLGWPLGRRGLLAARCGALATTRPGREGYPDASLLAEISRG